tara:strand:- start:1518 stop:1970 length:453 start_codon:yes stop_codon:yes gene_type:complete
MSYQPYSPNAQGFTEALIDYKSNFPGQVSTKINGFAAEAFENLVQGDAVYSRASDGKLGKAIANDTQDKARVVGFVETTTSAGKLVRCIVEGVTPLTGLESGKKYFLSDSSAGSITKNPPVNSGHFVTRVGQAATTASLIVKTEPPIELA